MFAYYKRIKIRAKIILCFIFIFVLFLFFSIFILLNSYDVASKRDTLDKSRIAIDRIMAIRVNEKNFFITGDHSFALENEEKIKELKTILSQLKKNEAKKEIKGKIDTLVTLIDLYNNSFNRMVYYKVIRDINSLSAIDKRFMRKYNKLQDISGNRNKGLKWILKEDYQKLLLINSGNNNLINRLSLLIENYLEERKPENINLIANTIIELKNSGDLDTESEDLVMEIRDTIYSIASLDSMIKGEEAEFKEYIRRLERAIVDYIEYIKKYVDIVVLISMISSLIVIVALIAIILLSAFFTVKEITKPIRLIYKSTGSIKDVSKRLSEIVERKTITTMRVSNSIIDIKGVISNQNQVIDMSGEAIIRLIRHITKISEISEHERKSIVEMRRNIVNTKEHVAELAVSIEGLKNTYSDMMKITGLVQDIAEKSRVLAVNAGIEASNAGEFGLVLKIVAREIKDLSSEVSFKSKEMGKLINGNMKTIEEAVSRSGSIKDEFILLSEEVEKNALTVMDMIDKIARINGETADIKNCLEKLQSVACHVDRNTEVMMCESTNMRGNIDELRKVKVDTNNAINEIINNIGKLTDENDSIRLIGV